MMRAHLDKIGRFFIIKCSNDKRFNFSIDKGKDKKKKEKREDMVPPKSWNESSVEKVHVAISEFCGIGLPVHWFACLSV